MKTGHYAIFNTSYNEIRPELQGSILRGILGSLAGMVICTLVLLLAGYFIQEGSVSCFQKHCTDNDF